MEKVLIIGYGSIGRRHSMVLRDLGFDTAFLRSGNSKLIEHDKKNLGSNTFFDLEEAIEKFKPKYAVDCSPSSLHLRNLFKLFNYRVNVLIEKPLIIDENELSDMENLKNILNQENFFVGIGFQYRFHPLINKLKNIYKNLDNQNIICGNVIWTEYLPDWHSWENYKESYAAIKELGGGCLLTLCHPFDYLNYIFDNGKFCDTFSVPGRLEISPNQAITSHFVSKKINDINLYIDFDSKINRHKINLEGKDWNIFADLNKGNLKITQNSKDNIEINLGTINRNNQFREMHMEYNDWINGKGSFRSKLIDHLDLAIYLSNKNKNLH